MKTFTATLLVAALIVPGLASPALAQQPKPQPQQHEQQKRPTQAAKPQAQTQKKTVGKTAQKQTYKTFRMGEKFDRRYAKNYQIIDYRKYKKLPAPKKGYRYVRSGSDVLLIGTTTFKIYAVYSGVIR